MNRSTGVLLLLLLGGCSFNDLGAGLMMDKTSDWFHTGQIKKSREDIARTVRELITRQGYVTPDFDASAERIETTWDTHLSVRYREGYRTKIEAEILPVEAGGFNVRVRSTMEINDNDNQVSDPERARWVGAGVSERHKSHIPEPAMKLNLMLKYRFFGLNP